MLVIARVWVLFWVIVLVFCFLSSLFLQTQL